MGEFSKVMLTQNVEEICPYCRLQNRFADRHKRSYVTILMHL